MGSSPSKNGVVNIRISSSKGRTNSSKNEWSNAETRTKDSSKSSRSTDLQSDSEIAQIREELRALQIELSAQKDKCSQAEEMSFSFQTQLDEREREVLLLREELSSPQDANLSSTVSDKEIEVTQETEENFNRTVYAKDQYIKTLEEELNTIRQHATTQNDRYQKKLKKLRGTLSKSRQDSSLKMFEMKDVNVKLSEENTKLQERIERLSMDSGEFSRQGSATSARSLQQSCDKAISNDVIDHHDDPRMKLILELSEQVANLDSENLKLKQELRHCRKIAEKVEQVRVQAKKKSVKTDIVMVDNSSCSWIAIDGSHSRLEIGEQA